MPVPPETLEAMILAHRKVLRELLASLPPERLERVRHKLLPGDTVQDGTEDPGVFPQEAFSVEAGIAEETRIILRMVDDLLRHRGE